ncbi:Dabb family protein [Cryobacterium tepidiphilum]|uniref:Dabb family protein n=1 Tax=Cryobacterium tepidiphilum TaxID=2486026 RepID=A0A3M8LAW2_9MICO|nr:Dabb family protein [Cryobacterium tepidiphilum]RNE62089.1 Dabb family protein [Cryobacterium tepidiphilum]
MTIRHIVSWQLAATDPAEKAESVRTISTALHSLVGVVDDIRSLHVGTDVVGGGNWDIALVADFDDVDAVGRYQVHPAHQEVAALVRSLVSARASVDFEV